MVFKWFSFALNINLCCLFFRPMIIILQVKVNSNNLVARRHALLFYHKVRARNDVSQNVRLNWLRTAKSRKRKLLAKKKKKIVTRSNMWIDNASEKFLDTKWCELRTECDQSFGKRKFRVWKNGEKKARKLRAHSFADANAVLQQ